MDLIPNTRAKRLQKRHIDRWNFKNGCGEPPPLFIRGGENYRKQLKNEVSAMWHVVGQNIKGYWAGYTAAAAVSLGAMCLTGTMTKSPAVQVASMITFPLLSAWIMQQCDSAVKVARQAKKDCDDILTRLDKGSEVPSTLSGFITLYPAFMLQQVSYQSVMKRIAKPHYKWSEYAYRGYAEWQKERG